MHMEITRLVVLAGICALAYLAGEALARLHIPRLPVYLAVGAIASILVKSAVESANLAFPVLNDVALCVIGFVAGSHLVWKVIKPRIRPIGYQVIGMTIAVPVLVTVFIMLVLPADVPSAARVATALLVGSVMLALSPPEAIAVISESKAVGPFTLLVLGATVVMDVVVVSTFSIALTLSKAILGGELALNELVTSVLAGLVLAALAGLLVGLLLKAAIERVRSNTVMAVLVFALAALAAWAASAFKGWAHARLGVEVEIESLLVAMIAGLFVANRTSAPERFAGILERLAPWVYVVFFTLTGLGLHVETLIAAAVPALLLWTLRVGGLWAGSTVAMVAAKEPPLVRRIAWRAFVPQAGIALALAATIASEFPEGGPLIASVIIGTIVINEATGPFFLRSALHAAGEVVPEGEVLD